MTKVRNPEEGEGAKAAVEMLPEQSVGENQWSEKGFASPGQLRLSNN
jgi:hypothetical protein